MDSEACNLDTVKINNKIIKFVVLTFDSIVDYVYH